MMRTTLDLDDALLEAARSVAAQSKRSLGAVISEWARRGLSPRGDGAGRRKGRIPTFDVPPDAAPLNPARIKELVDDEGLAR